MLPPNRSVQSRRGRVSWADLPAESFAKTTTFAAACTADVSRSESEAGLGETTTESGGRDPANNKLIRNETDMSQV